jgi:plastocyanin
VTIRLNEYSYRPSTITIHVGQEVRFVNLGKIQHTNADTDRRWRIQSNLIKPRPLSHGQVQVVRFREVRPRALPLHLPQR